MSRNLVHDQRAARRQRRRHAARHGRVVDSAGANVEPAFSQKYFAIYSQNDWRPTSKLTVNLGLRWEVQPGPTERFDRMSSWDFTAAELVRIDGRDRVSRVMTATAATCGTRPTTTGALASARPISGTTRWSLRGGFGITYLPTNTGYFSGPTDYGSANFSGGVLQQAYGTSPAGVPVIRFSDPAPISPALGGDETNPGVYGIGEARFDRDLANGQARQWNFFVERSLGSRWMASIGYSASFSRNLHNRSFPIQNMQSIDPAMLAEWRESVHRQQRHAEPGDAAGPESDAAGDWSAGAVCRRPRPAHDRAAEHALPVSSCSSARTRPSTSRRRRPTTTR